MLVNVEEDKYMMNMKNTKTNQSKQIEINKHKTSKQTSKANT
jgi:hypothetical protein